VVERGDDARYVSTGDLVFIRNQTLYAAPFDANTLQLKGPVVRVLDGVQQTTAAGGIFAVSPASQLVYARSLEGNRRRLAMVDRRGNLTPLDLPPRNLQSPSISPDGRKIVFEDLDLPHSIWIFDVTTNALSKLAPPDNRHNPIWSWDGSRIVFQTNREGPGGGSVYWMRADGSGPEERLVAAKQANLNAVSWLPRGQGLAVVEVTNNDRNVMLYRLGSGGSLQPLLQTPAFESLAQFSPDGRWLAYVSNVSKRDEVYVRPFPGSGGLWQVSNDGGTQPLWSRDGRELFYRRGDTVMTVTVNATTVFASTRPRELFTNASLAFRANILDYDVFPDGQRFVMVEELNPSGSAQLHVVTEWFDELKRNRESRR